MPLVPKHPILKKSFDIIDQEIGDHDFAPEEYAILRRVIHSTADFEFVDLLSISPEAIASGETALRGGCPIVVDVGMVRQGCQSMVERTFGNTLITAIDLIESADTGKTRTETGILKAYERFPEALYVIGNAPTALKALCHCIATGQPSPSLIIGTPVGFVGVQEAKQQLSSLKTPKILTAGRKGGSAVAAAILNALLVLAWESQP